MKRTVSLIAGVLLLAGTAAASEGDRAKLQDRLDQSATILNEIMAAPDAGIPEEIFNNAICVAVVPSMIKAGLGFGGQYGQGVVTCRTEKAWSAPAFYRLGGGSFGLQIGGQAVDLVMLFMNDKGMRSLLTHKVKLGADAAAAAGPVGRHAAADTDVAFRSEVLTYSRSRGLFAGITLNGSWVEQNDRDTRDFYGRYIPFQTILGGGLAAPAAAQNFLSTVTRYTTGTSAPAAASAGQNRSQPTQSPTAGTTQASPNRPAPSGAKVQSPSQTQGQSQPQQAVQSPQSNQSSSPRQEQPPSATPSSNADPTPVPKQE